MSNLIADRKAVERWLVQEFRAKAQPYNKDEYNFSCPFCDPKNKHHDYNFNVRKMQGRDWRGFDERCESGHSLLTFVALYYDVKFEKAKEIIQKKFDEPNKLKKVKNKVRNFDESRIIRLDDRAIVWDMPNEVQSIVEPETKGAQRALKWLLETRKIPMGLIEVLEPKYLSYNATNKRWRRYAGRVFFPIETKGNKAWLAYSIEKEVTKYRPKTMNPPGSVLSQLLYLYDFYVDKKKPLILNEGIFDSLRLFIYGFNATPLFGTSISATQIELLNELSCNEVVVCLDPGAETRAQKMCRALKEYYFGKVSFMKLRKDDPDDTPYEEIVKRFKSRETYGDFRNKITKLKAISQP